MSPTRATAMPSLSAFEAHSKSVRVPMMLLRFEPLTALSDEWRDVAVRMIQVSDYVAGGRMGAWSETMDRLLPPRISVSNSRKRVGEQPVAFLKRRLK